MTPDTRMVTDAEAKAWQRGLERNLRRRPEIVRNGDFNALRRLLADRGRWMALAEMVDAAEDADESFPYVLEARKLLKEAHGE